MEKSSSKLGLAKVIETTIILGALSTGLGCAGRFYRAPQRAPARSSQSYRTNTPYYSNNNRTSYSSSPRVIYRSPIYGSSIFNRLTPFRVYGRPSSRSHSRAIFNSRNPHRRHTHPAIVAPRNQGRHHGRHQGNYNPINQGRHNRRQTNTHHRGNRGNNNRPRSNRPRISR